jgi:hypothetical protein
LTRLPPAAKHSLIVSKTEANADGKHLANAGQYFSLKACAAARMASAVKGVALASRPPSALTVARELDNEPHEVVIAATAMGATPTSSSRRRTLRERRRSLGELLYGTSTPPGAVVVSAPM